MPKIEHRHISYAVWAFLTVAIAANIVRDGMPFFLGFVFGTLWASYMHDFIEYRIKGQRAGYGNSFRKDDDK